MVISGTCPGISRFELTADIWDVTPPNAVCQTVTLNLGGGTVNLVPAQVDGGSVKKRLEWISKFGLLHNAYYDRSDLKDLNYLHDFSARLSKHKWRLYEHINVEDVHHANALALDALNMGCEGILFSLSRKSDLELLTKGVLFEHCEVSFLLNGYPDKDLCEFRIAKNVSGYVLSSEGQFFGWHSDMFSQNSGLDNLSEMVINYAQSPKKSPAVFLKLRNDFFSEMARIRALKYLFWRVAAVTGLQLDPNEILIHCEAEESEVPDENLFALTTASLSAVIGGANSVSFPTTNSNERIKRNIGNLIREETKIDAFENASLGSYFIDHLTDQIIRHVWAKLQETTEL